MTEDPKLNEIITNSDYVLFLGAGASAPLGRKPTVQFLELLIEKLPGVINECEGNSPQAGSLLALFEQAAQHYQVTLPDSEVVLNYLDYLRMACKQLHDLPDEFRDLARTGGVGAYHEQWAHMLENLRQCIEEIVDRHYSNVDRDKALKLYTPLLSNLESQAGVVPIFTTNYDWTFETLASGPSQFSLVDGFTSDAFGGQWSRKVFDSFKVDGRNETIVLFKLHGSTTWYKDPAHPGLIRRSTAGDSPRVLIYPTRVKPDVVGEEPFSTAYEYFRHTLRQAKLCVVIGFSFRDPAVNDIISQGLDLNSALRLVIVEPRMNESPGVDFNALVKDLGIAPDDWQHRIVVIKGKFGEESFVQPSIATIVKKLDKWNELESHCIDADSYRISLTRR